MKKLLIFLLILIVGCTKNTNYYNIYLKELKNVEESSKEIPVSIKIEYDKVTDEEIMYQVVIENPKLEMNSVKALAIHDQKTKDIYPSVGIIDEAVNLKPGVVDDNYKKGLLLIGYIPFDKDINEFMATFKVLIVYKDEFNNEQKVYYVTKIRQ